MKNTLQDLNNHLFEQLERLNDEDLTDEQLDRELRRAEGMTKIATQIIENGELAFKTMVHMDEYERPRSRTPTSRQSTLSNQAPFGVLFFFSLISYLWMSCQRFSGDISIFTKINGKGRRPFWSKNRNPQISHMASIGLRDYARLSANIRFCGYSRFLCRK